MPIICEPAVTNARIAPLRFASRALVTSGIRIRHRIGGLPSAARRQDVALRLRSARRFSPLSTPLSPLADHRPKPEIRIRGQGAEFDNQ
jgi:hypothetical protein